MKGKIAFVFGATVGYVLGTRAGRQRYEQIKRAAQAFWGSAPVQRGATAVRGAVDDRVEVLKKRAVRTAQEAFSGFTHRASPSARTSHDAGDHT